MGDVLLLYWFCARFGPPCAKSPARQARWAAPARQKVPGAAPVTSLVSDRSNVIMAYLEHNHEDIREMMHGLVAKHREEDINT